ncbi:MAG: hypothetical protein DMG81_18550 [Acidobacteria bacterium]|nr:MAG: hypothetical protein DMG81_18550 [Acidobacteriota bacterium]
MRWLLGFFVLLASFSTPSAFAQGRIDCSSLQSKILKRAVHYCVQVPGNYDKAPDTRYPVLYYLHGLGDNEQSFSRSGGWTLIEDLREHGKIGDFLIVAPEGGASFYINSADGEQRYSDFFLREFMPYTSHYWNFHGRLRRTSFCLCLSGAVFSGERPEPSLDCRLSGRAQPVRPAGSCRSPRSLDRRPHQHLALEGQRSIHPAQKE